MSLLLSWSRFCTTGRLLLLRNKSPCPVFGSRILFTFLWYLLYLNSPLNALQALPGNNFFSIYPCAKDEFSTSPEKPFKVVKVDLLIWQKDFAATFTEVMTQLSPDSSFKFHTRQSLNNSEEAKEGLCVGSNRKCFKYQQRGIDITGKMASIFLIGRTAHGRTNYFTEVLCSSNGRTSFVDDRVCLSHAFTWNIFLSWLYIYSWAHWLYFPFRESMLSAPGISAMENAILLCARYFWPIVEVHIYHLFMKGSVEQFSKTHPTLSWRYCRRSARP